MAKTHTAGRAHSGLFVRMALLAGWIGLCDVWLKLMARAAGCPQTTGVVTTAAHPWTLPERCDGAPFVGEMIRLAPGVRDGGPFGMLAPTFVGVPGQLWALALLALATTLSIVVMRWQWRSTGDGLALGALWGAVLTLALPRLLASGGLVELAVGGVPLGLGDLALVWALVWLAWRAIAELRA